MTKLLLTFALVTSIAFGVTANKVWRIPTGGTLGGWGPILLSDAANAVSGVLGYANGGAFTRATGTTVSVGGVAFSNSIGNFTTTSTSYTDVTNGGTVTATITTTGHPVRLTLVPDGTNGCSLFSLSTSGNANFAYLEGTTIKGVIDFQSNGLGSTGVVTPGGGYELIYTPAAGTYTYKMQIRSGSGGAVGFQATGCKMVVYEL